MDFDVNTLANMMSMFGNKSAPKAGAAASDNAAAASQLSTMLPMIMNMLGGGSASKNAPTESRRDDNCDVNTRNNYENGERDEYSRQSEKTDGLNDGFPPRNFGGYEQTYGNTYGETSRGNFGGRGKSNGYNDKTRSRRNAYGSNFARLNGIGESTDAFINNTDDMRRTNNAERGGNARANEQSGIEALSNLLPMLMNLSSAQKTAVKTQSDGVEKADKSTSSAEEKTETNLPESESNIEKIKAVESNEKPYAEPQKNNNGEPKSKPRFFNDLRERVERGRVKKRLPERCNFSTVSFAGEEVAYALRRLNYGLNAKR